MMRLGITPIIHPAFLWTLGETMFAALGPERSEKLYRARSFIDSGIKLVSSSDRPVAEGAPLKGLDMLLNRRTPAGRIIGGSERIDIVPAIKSYTLNSAWISNAEAERGSIKDRMLADFIIVSDDVIAQPEALESARVVATYLGGECVYES